MKLVSKQIKTRRSPAKRVGPVGRDRSAPKLKEKAIESQILSFLRWKGFLVFKVENGGVFNEKRGAYIFNRTVRTPGVADIIACLPGGKFAAIEVKSMRGKLSAYQEEFLKNVREQGGIAIVARSIEDVELALGI